MPDDSYSVKINRRDGVVEISGPDKDWIADQLVRLEMVYRQALHDERPEPLTTDPPEAEEAGEPPKIVRRRRSAARSTPRSGKASGIASKLTKQVTDKLHAYVEERPAALTTHQNRAAVIAGFLMDELSTDGIDGHDLIAVYRAMGWAPPRNPSAVIRNAIDRNHYFGGFLDGRVHLTPTGEHFARHASKEQPAEK